MIPLNKHAQTQRIVCISLFLQTGKKKKKSLQVIQIDQAEEDTATGVLVSKGTLALSIIKFWLKY